MGMVSLLSSHMRFLFFFLPSLDVLILLAISVFMVVPNHILHTFLGATKHLYKRVCPSVGR